MPALRSAQTSHLQYLHHHPECAGHQYLHNLREPVCWLFARNNTFPGVGPRPRRHVRYDFQAFCRSEDTTQYLYAPGIDQILPRP